MSDARILSKEDCRTILERAHGFATGGGETTVAVTSWWQGELRWGRNRASLSSDRRDIAVRVERTLPRYNGTGDITTNQLDDVSLEAAVRAAEGRARHRPEVGPAFEPPSPRYERFADAAIWSEATYGLGPEARGEVVRAMIARAEAEGFYSAGYLELRAGSTGWFTTTPPELRRGMPDYREIPYTRWTQAHCSTTVRDRTGMGSGWAGLSSYDWDRIDASTLADRAVRKCRLSRDPVALEPGRYTVILEPQAVADLMGPLLSTLGYRNMHEAPRGGTVWHLGYDAALALGRSKLGIKVVDERVTIRHDPGHPQLGIVMYPMQHPGPVTWIERGVLTNLGHEVDYAIHKLEGRHALRGPIGYRMSGGEASVEEMIRTTRRGLLVTRLSGIRQLDSESLLSTGLTRDGLWLIENGEITKAVKNFRFTESPLFALNNIEQLGEPVPVFRPTRNEAGTLTPAIVPPLKVRDFSFTSLIDAV